jgi:3-oxoacyl-[acyl-carrier protein] reductase
MQYLDYGLEGKRAIVTGAGTGIGKGCAIELAKGGAKVALLGRRPEPLNEVQKECAACGVEVMVIPTDVSDRAADAAAVAETVKRFGGVDILINNAGIESRLKPGQRYGDLFDSFDEEGYLKFFKIHVMGHYFMNLEVVPHMQKQRFGRVVNITSVTGLTGTASSPPYTASKAAAILQTKPFARKYGEYNITFNSISPGMVDTPMKSDLTQEQKDMTAQRAALRRYALPIDIARVAMFFVQENLYVTGENLVVDGGSN